MTQAQEHFRYTTRPQTPRHKFETFQQPTNETKMTTCISRRAYADRFTIRLVNDEGEIGKHIWTEFRCPNVVSKENEICVDCSVKMKKYKYQANQKCNHGIIGGPYTDDSKLYGSPYYLREIKAGWRPTETDELRAKADVLKACSNMPRKKVQAAPTEPVAEPLAEPLAEPVIEVAPTVSTLVVEKKKRTYNRKKTVIEATEQATPVQAIPVQATPVEIQAPKVKPPKLKVPRAKKILPTEVLLPQVQVIEKPVDLVAKFVEVVAPPITITDFVVVKVKKLKSQGKDYYYDEASGKVYGISVNGVGAYKGRYKEEDDVVDTTFPDSDDE